MATRIGADSFGDDLMGLWSEEGIDTSCVEHDVDAPTGLYFVRHGPDSRIFEYRRVDSAASRMAPEMVPRAAVGSVRCLHYSAISQAICGTALAACEAAVDAARAARWCHTTQTLAAALAVGKGARSHPPRRRSATSSCLG